METDLKHLRLLSIFHYVMGGLTALIFCFPIIHIVMGLTMIFDPNQYGMGWVFLIAGIIAIVVGWTIAIAIILTGRFLQQRKNRTFCIVVAALECLSFPIGTLLGVFTLIVLFRPSAEALFNTHNSKPI